MFDTEILQDQSAIADFVSNTYRPAAFVDDVPVDKQGHPLVSNRQLATNAYLNQEEWERLDSAITRRMKQRFQIIDDIRSAGLVTQTSLAEWLSKWRVASEMTAASVALDFETGPEEDRIDMKTYSVPIPIISKKFSLGRRELLTSRQLGSDLDTVNAEEAAVAVAEMLEYITVNGLTTVDIQGHDIPGLRTLSARHTGSADGDFGTLSNIYSTFRKAVIGMASERYYGPFNVYIANTQYGEMLEHYSDGTGQTALERVVSIPQISKVEPNDLMTAGEFVMIQMAPECLDMRVAMDVETRQWDAPDGSRMNFVVAMAAVVRLKTDYAGESGICHYSSC
jgi:uncharacterized linocin/CFP29 family protein